MLSFEQLAGAVLFAGIFLSTKPVQALSVSGDERRSERWGNGADGEKAFSIARSH